MASMWSAGVTTAGLEILAHRGFHPWPFQLGLSRAARMVERHLEHGARRALDGQPGDCRAKAVIGGGTRLT